MDKTAIISLPNPHLRTRSKKVGLIGERTKKLIKDMQDATLDWENSRQHEVGVALAAIQVDKLLRIIVIRNDFDNKADKNFTVFINPEITKYEGKIEYDFEGCLSVPDIYGKVPRYQRVHVRYQDEAGKWRHITAEGFLARVFQHEIDHTNGKVFIDHIKDVQDAFFRLTEDGQLQKLDYEQDIRANSLLW